MLSKYVRLLLNIIRDPPPLLMPVASNGTPLQGRRVWFRAFDGTVLQGMFLTSESLSPCPTRHFSFPRSQDDRQGSILNFDKNTRGIVIFSHEYGSDMYSCSRYCLSLLQAGFNIFTFDYRSHGQSASLPHYTPRPWCSDKEISDCLGAINFIKDQLDRNHIDIPIGLFGISRGAAAAIIAAGHPHCTRLIKAVLVDSVFSTDITLEWSMKKWVHIFAKVRIVYENHRPFFWHFLRWLVLQFARIRFHCSFPSVRKTLYKLKNVPVFFIHGRRDSYIRPQQAQVLFDTASTSRYLWIVPRAKHNQASMAEPERYAERTVAFFEKYLSQDITVSEKIKEEFQPDIATFTDIDNEPPSSKKGLAHVSEKMVDPPSPTDSILRGDSRPTQTPPVRKSTTSLPPRAG